MSTFMLANEYVENFDKNTTSCRNMAYIKAPVSNNTNGIKNFLYMSDYHSVYGE